MHADSARSPAPVCTQLCETLPLSVSQSKEEACHHMMNTIWIRDLGLRILDLSRCYNGMRLLNYEKGLLVGVQSG